MTDKEDIFKPPEWQNIEIIDAEKRMAELTPEQMFMTLQNATDEQLEAVIDEANQKGYSINLNIPATEETIDYFFKKVFICKRCGKCCRGELQSVRTRKEFVIVLEREIIEIASFLKTRPRKVKKLCSRNDKGLLCLPAPCPFYRDTPKPQCSIYPVRPLTCRYYPLYSVVAYKGMNERVNGKPLLSIDGECPQAREIALNIFKGMRNAVQRRAFTGTQE